MPSVITDTPPQSTTHPAAYLPSPRARRSRHPRRPTPERQAHRHPRRPLARPARSPARHRRRHARRPRTCRRRVRHRHHCHHRRRHRHHRRRHHPRRPATHAPLTTNASTATLSPAIVADLINRARPRWGVRTPDDATAYIAFWTTLTARHHQPALHAAFADVLHLLGPAHRHPEALQCFLTAVHHQPALFTAYAGDFIDLATHLDLRRPFELAKLAFYRHLVARGHMPPDDLATELHDFRTDFGDDPTTALDALALASHWR